MAAPFRVVSAPFTLVAGPLASQTWRPHDAPLCVEVYSTGRANLPGSKSHNDLLVGFVKLVPELLAYSSSGGGVCADAADVDDEAEGDDSGGEEAVRTGNSRLMATSDAPAEEDDNDDDDVWDGWMDAANDLRELGLSGAAAGLP